MQDLTSANIEIIIAEVSKANISFSHLRDELIDHICCEVENEMQDGLSFEKAFEKVKKIIGNKGLKKVQENTLLLIDKKYRFMKRTMKISGLVSMIMMTIGAILKIQHFPGAGPLLILSFILMTLVFLPASLYVLKTEIPMKGSKYIFILALLGGIPLLVGVLFKIQHYPGAGILLVLGYLTICIGLIPAILVSKLRNQNEKKLHGVYILGAISISLYLLGDLFKTQHYPGGGPLLMIGAVLLTTVFLPIYGYKIYKNTEYVKGSFIYLCIGILFFNLFNILLAINVSKNVLEYYIKPGKEVLSNTKLIEQNNAMLFTQLINDSLTNETTINPKVKIIESLSDEVFNYIENIKTDIVMSVDGCDKKDAEFKVQHPTLILAKDNWKVPTSILCGKDQEDASKGKASILKMKIITLKDSLLKYCDNSEDAKTIIEKALETNYPININENYNSWEMYHFYNMVTIAVLNDLSYFQRNIRIAESQALQYLVENKNAKNIKNENI